MCNMSCREVFRVFATSAGSRIVCAPGHCRSAAPGSTRPLPPKWLPSRSPRYGVARTAMGPCISSNRSRLPSFSLPNERSSIPLTPHRTWLSTAILACFPARLLFVRLQPKQSFPAPRFPSVRLHPSPSSALPRTPARQLRLSCLLTSPASALRQAIQNP